MLLMNLQLQCCVHDHLENMLIMASLFVMTAVMVADATPACSYYCETLFFSSKSPRPVDCDCNSLQDSLLKRFKRQVLANQSTLTPQSKGQKTFTMRNTSYHTIENESLNINVNKEEDSKGDPNKIKDTENFIQIDTIRKCVIVHSILMSGRKVNNTKFKVNLKTDEINSYYKHRTDTEIMEIVNNECNGVGTNSDWNMNNDPTLNGINNNNINLKEENFSVISESIKLFKDMDSTFFKYKRTHHTQLQLSAPKEMLLTENSTKSRTMLSTTENTTATPTSTQLQNSSTRSTTENTPPPKKHPTERILTAKDITEKIDLSQNITSTVEHKNILETSTLNPQLNRITSTNDNTKLNNTNLLDRNGNSVGQITESILESVKHQTSKFSKDHNESTKRISEMQYSTSTTRNNITSKSLSEATQETAKITTSTIIPTKDIKNEFRALGNKPKSNYLNNNDNNDGTFFRRNYNARQYYNESEIPVVRIFSREYPNDTVSSIINGTEILPNDDFRDEEFKSTSVKVYKINHIAVPIADSPYPFVINPSQSKKHSLQKDTVEKTSAKYNIDGKLYFKCKRKLSGPLQMSLEISTICDQTDKQNKSQSILLSILCSCMQFKKCS